MPLSHQTPTSSTEKATIISRHLFPPEAGLSYNALEVAKQAQTGAADDPPICSGCLSRLSSEYVTSKLPACIPSRESTISSLRRLQSCTFMQRFGELLYIDAGRKSTFQLTSTAQTQISKWASQVPAG